MMTAVKNWLVIPWLAVGLFSCTDGGKTGRRALFTLLSSSSTGVNFSNPLHYTEELNMYTFRNFYNGGRVGVGDINNDGLPDLFFCSNQGSNKLYLNKGGFVFEDITTKAGVGSEGVWSTGVSMADVNGDGWVDIYVCKSGDLKGKQRANQLFIGLPRQLRFLQSRRRRRRRSAATHCRDRQPRSS